MKKYLLWSFERGSRAYDVICIVILAFIFLTPRSVFHDHGNPGSASNQRRNCMPGMTDQTICQTSDADGRPIWVVQVKTEQDAVDRLKAFLGAAITIARTEPVYDAEGQLVAYSIWIQR